MIIVSSLQQIKMAVGEEVVLRHRQKREHPIDDDSDEIGTDAEDLADEGYLISQMYHHHLHNLSFLFTLSFDVVITT